MEDVMEQHSSLCTRIPDDSYDASEQPWSQHEQNNTVFTCHRHDVFKGLWRKLEQVHFQLYFHVVTDQNRAKS